MLRKFRAYQLAVQFYKSCEKLRGQKHLLDQLLRSASSVVLNLAEGSERVTNPDRRRFYRMAMGSLRESQAILDLLPASAALEQTKQKADETAATIYGLCRALDNKLTTTGTESGVQSPESGKTDT